MIGTSTIVAGTIGYPYKEKKNLQSLLHTNLKQVEELKLKAKIVKLLLKNQIITITLLYI